MALQAILTDTSASGIAVNLGTTDDAVIGTQVMVVSGSNAVQGQGSNQAVTVFGSIYATQTGVYLGGTGATFEEVTIAASGQVIGESSAISIFAAQSVVTNAGSVMSTGWGIYVQATGAGYGTVTNYGTIVAGTGVGAVSSEKMNFTNFGTINATNGAFYAGDEVVSRVVNHGTMVGDLNFGDLNDSLVNDGDINGTIRMGAGNDQITMKGHYSGIIDLGDGDNAYDGHLAAVDEIRVIGSSGDDSFQLGGAFETIEGGDGIDSISFYSARSKVNVSLVPGASGTGLAAGDSYYDIENVFGGRHNDNITGSASANVLNGNSGNDVLFGGGGKDTLIGGDGVDKMTGGGGNDTFQFYALPTDGADKILDFSGKVGNNDVIEIGVYGFGGGLSAGSLAAGQFRSRDDHVAQDGNDRFIFDKTDNSLWFDDDGNGAHAAVMIVDLQASATLTLADILLI
ncbi:MAG: calcium-binding protein [bacterium]